MKVDYKITCKAAICMAEGCPEVIKDALILIRGNKISWIGPASQAPSDIEAMDEMAMPSFVAMPGLVNTHCHAAMVLMRGYGDDMALQEWLNEKIFPIEKGLEPDDVYWGTMLACIEMAKSGCTAFADMYFFMEQAAQAVADSGMRAAMARSVSSTTDPDHRKLEESLEFCLRWNGVADGRITTMLSPHSLYTCTAEYAKKLANYAKEHNLGIQTHLAETRREERYTMDLFGMSTAQKMNEIGLFDARTLAAHCVWLSDEDIDLLAEKHVCVAHNPGSNMKLASGIAHVTKMRRRGITIGLGTDGAASNNNLDMMEEMHLATLLEKVSTLDPTTMPAREALKMATSNGAKCLFGDSNIGMLAPGMVADIVFLDTRGAHMHPEHNILSNIVYSAQSSDVDTVFVNGKPILKGRKMQTVDEEEVLRQCETRAARLAGRAKV